MAYRLSKGLGSTPETWLAMQLAFDLAPTQPEPTRTESPYAYRRSINRRPVPRSVAHHPKEELAMAQTWCERE